MSGKSAQKRKDNNKQLFEQLKDTCPEHRIKDLESLIKKSKGDTTKISNQIQQWWDDPTPVVEEVWEDVSRKSSKKTQQSKYNRDRDGRDGHRGGGGRGYGRSGDRERGGRGYGRGMAGGRGGGADRRAKGRDGGRNGGRGRGRGAAADKKPLSGASGPAGAGAGAGPASAAPPVKKEEVVAGTPATVKVARPLQGAWGQRAAAAAAAPPAEPPAPAPLAPEEPALPVAPPAEPEPEPDVAEEVPPEIDVGVVSSQDPTPAGVVEPNTAATPAAPKPAPVPSGGNVWATKGSAHIIQKEKKPVVEVSPFVSEEPTSTIEAIDEPLLPDTVVEELIAPSAPSADDALDSGLPASVNGANINAAGWDPVSVDLVQPSPVGPVSVSSQPSSVVDAPLLDSTSAPVPVQETITPAAEPPVAEPAAPVASVESTLKPILNMGHWETGEGDESASHDFGFGSFGNDNDVASVEETASAAAAPVTSVPETVPPPTVSPARPPPGLGIGMPPMPEKIVHVHELENTLEKTSLTTKTEEKKDKVDTLPDNLTNTAPAATPVAVPPVGNEGFGQMPQPGAVPQQSYGGQYGMGMYNYNAQSGVGGPNGFMGVPAAPVLPGGVPPQQQKQQNLGQQQGGLHQQQQASIYGAPAPGNQTNDNTNNDSTNTPSNPTAGMPPGMHGMPQYNPALFYGQQPYQMGQAHGVPGYGYGFAGQYGGVQAGFGYQQVMGQGAGYGQPYEDQTQQHQQHHGGNNHQGGYNKNSGGGYRGRNNHHNQYQNQYNPQGHGGYGGQPYNMGYNDHFNQRGYGGPGNMDPYMNQGGYHQDDHQLGKGKPKGNSRNNFGNNNGMHNQYQQGGGNQFGGLQGGDSDRNGNNTTSNNNGLSYQGWGNGGL